MNGVTPQVNSWQMGMFVHSAVDESDLTVYEFRIYAHLCRRANDELRVWEGQKKMAEHCKMSRNAVQIALYGLVKKGWIRMEEKEREDGGQRANDVFVLGPPRASEKGTPASEKGTPASEKGTGASDTGTPLPLSEAPEVNPLEVDPIKLETPPTPSRGKAPPKERKASTKPPKEVHPDFHRTKALIGLWSYGDPEMKLVTGGGIINVSKVVNELLEKHGSADRLELIWANIRRDAFWGKEASITPGKIKDLMADAKYQPKGTPPGSAAPPAAFPEPGAPLEQFTPLAVRSRVAGARQALSEIRVALNGTTVTGEDYLRVKPHQSGARLAYSHADTYPAFLALMEAQGTDAARIREIFGESPLAY